MNTTSKPEKNINLHTLGFGYLNRVRPVTPRNGEPYLACTIAALYGPRQKPNRTYYDLIAYGAQAESVIRQFKEAVDAKSKVVLGFSIGDTYLHRFEYQNGPNKGQLGAAIKGRLLFVPWVNVDGKRAYTAPSRERDEEGLDEDSFASQDAPASKRSSNGATASAEASAPAA